MTIQPQRTDVVKEPSMLKQKAMIADNYDKLTSVGETGRKVVSTYVPGNLNELIMCFDMLNNLPEINAIQNGMRKKSGPMIREAEKLGHSEDVCAYVKADIGAMAKGNIAPNGKPMPPPDLLLLSYTGCFTFMKWFEILRDDYGCETVMLHVPYEGDGTITDNVGYMVPAARRNAAALWRNSRRMGPHPIPQGSRRGVPSVLSKGHREFGAQDHRIAARRHDSSEAPSQPIHHQLVSKAMDKVVSALRHSWLSDQT